MVGKMPPKIKNWAGQLVQRTGSCHPAMTSPLLTISLSPPPSAHFPSLALTLLGQGSWVGQGEKPS